MRRRNRIEGLLNNDGNYVTEPAELKTLAVDFYKALYSKNGMAMLDSDSLEHRFPSLTTEQLSALERPFAPIEVWNALKDMKLYKARGLDGFQAIFFQRYWNVAGYDTTQTVLGILNGQESLEALNHTSFMLMPKVEHPQSITQF